VIKMLASRSKHNFVYKAMALCVAMAFLFNTAWAYDMPDNAILTGSGMGGGGLSPGQLKLDLNKVKIPASLGYVKERYLADTDKPTVIYIQDAHCNYSCQKSIESIVSYFNKKYNIDLAAVEGGAGNYDYSIFTSIPDIDLREKIADYFVREGRVTGVDLFAIENPNKLRVLGLEQPELYDKNLNVYRQSLTFKEKVDKYLGILRHFINNLKKPIFSRKTSALDKEKTDYDNNKNNLKDYVVYLKRIALDNEIAIGKFQNLSRLLILIEDEDKINFKRAEKEREILLDVITKKLSKIEIATLVQKSIDFKKKDISGVDFYEYLFRKARSCGIDLTDYPHLLKYKAYLDKYDTVEKDVFFEEIFDAEHHIADNLFTADDERTLYYLSDDLNVLDKLFSVSLTRRLYDYYLERESEISAKKFIKFIHEKAAWHKIPAAINPDVRDLDNYKNKVGKFYEYSFERDKVFVKNIDKYSKGLNALFVVTGGFHTDNMISLMKQRGYSYILITPKIISEKDNPYFHLLSGGLSPIESLVSEYTAALALRSPFSEMGLKSDSVAMQESVNALVEALRRGEDSSFIQDLPLGLIKYTLRSPDYPPTADEKSLGNIANMQIIARPLGLDEIEDADVIVSEDEMTHETITYEGHEIYDIMRKWAMNKEHGLTHSKVTIDDKGIYHEDGEDYIFKLFKGLPNEEAYKKLLLDLFRGVPNIDFVGRQKEGLSGLDVNFKYSLDHASHNGIYITYRGSYEAMAGKTLHELAAYYGMPAAFNDELEKAVLAEDKDKVIEALGEIKTAADRGQHIQEDDKREVAGRPRDLAGVGETGRTLNNEDLTRLAADLERVVGYDAASRKIIMLARNESISRMEEFQLNLIHSLPGREEVYLAELLEHPLTVQEEQFLRAIFFEVQNRMENIERRTFYDLIRNPLKYIQNAKLEDGVTRHALAKLCGLIYLDVEKRLGDLVVLEEKRREDLARKEAEKELITMQVVASTKRPETLDICVVQYVDISDPLITARNAAKEIGIEAKEAFGKEAIVGVYAQGNKNDFKKEVQTKLLIFNQNVEIINTEMTIYAYPDVVDLANDLIEKTIDPQYRDKVRVVQMIVPKTLPINQTGFIDLAIGVHSEARYRRGDFGKVEQDFLDRLMDQNIALLKILVENPDAINKDTLMGIYYNLEPLRCKGIGETISRWRVRQKALMRSL